MSSLEGWRRKASQEWDMAGLAWQDGDMTAAARHQQKAREYERLARSEAEAQGVGRLREGLGGKILPPERREK